MAPTVETSTEQRDVEDRFNKFLSELRAKWRELPSGNDSGGRHIVTDLDAMSSDDLLSFWEARAAEGDDVRGWYRRLYAPLLVGKRVLELGSGLGFDGLYFGDHGAEWHFSDVVEENQALIERLAEIKGQTPLGFRFIDNLEALRSLPDEFDIIWANGSLINAPFDLIAEESRIALSHLKPGGRWIELTYPFERWVREGSLPFNEWGVRTDGEGTPWVEWYDLERLKQRLAPAVVKPVLDFNFASDAYAWLDVEVTGEQHQELADTREIAPPAPVTTPDGIWHFAEFVSFQGALADRAGDVSADITCRVDVGSVGFAFMQEGTNAYTGREVTRDAQSNLQRLTITGPAETTSGIMIRNTFGHGPSKVTVESIDLRSAL